MIFIGFLDGGEVNIYFDDFYRQMSNCKCEIPYLYFHILDMRYAALCTVDIIIYHLCDSCKQV